MAAAKFDGTWLQENVEGEITEWFAYMNVGFMARQALWMHSYGSGTITIDQLFHEGKLCAVRFVDASTSFRTQIVADGNKQPLLYSDCFPATEFRNFGIEASFSDGKVSGVIYGEEGSVHHKVKKSVSEDGQVMTTVATFPAGEWGGEEGGECCVTFTHRKQEGLRLTAETVKGWCPPVLVADVTDEVGKPKKAAVTVPLEGLFPSAQALIKVFEAEAKAPEGKDGYSLKEVSESEFTTTFDLPIGSGEFEHKVDVAACTMVVKSTIGGTCLGHWNYKALSDPLRLQCWNTMEDDLTSTASSIMSTQDILDKLLKRAR